MSTPNTPQSCWCDAPAEFVNEATDAMPEHPCCGEHTKDGYRPLHTTLAELQFVAQLATPGRVAGDVACAIQRAFERGKIRDRNGAALLSAPHIRIDTPKG